jgi:WD repeat-containing protein 6
MRTFISIRNIALNVSLIFQILIWKLAPQVLGSSMVCSNEGDTSDVNSPKIMNPDDSQHMAVHLGRLKEHEGSIFRIAWSSDGSKFMSVSDDRRLVYFNLGSH